MREKTILSGTWTLTGYDKSGKIKLNLTKKNLITNQGLDHLLNVTMHEDPQTTTWYVGLKNVGTVAATDTMALHAGWTENVNYSEAARPAYVEAASASQVISNSANVAVFTFSTDGNTIAGSFLSAISTKGGATGILLSAMDFTSSVLFNTGDVLNVRYDLSAADDGV